MNKMINENLRKIFDVPVLIFPSTGEGREAFLLINEAQNKNLLGKVEFCPSERETRPILLYDDEKLVGSGEIQNYIKTLISQ